VLLQLGLKFVHAFSLGHGVLAANSAHVYPSDGVLSEAAFAERNVAALVSFARPALFQSFLLLPLFDLLGQLLKSVLFFHLLFFAVDLVDVDLTIDQVSDLSVDFFNAVNEVVCVFFAKIHASGQVRVHSSGIV
jgi:hypothetical protein